MMPARKPKPELAADDVAGRLLACHDRIRTHTALAMRLSGATGTAADEIAEAARALGRYFRVALPLHAEDEDLLLAPALREHTRDAEILEAVERVATEHPDIHAAIDHLDPLWARVAADPTELAAVAQQLADGAALLEDRFAPHLELEERLIIPKLALILPSEVRTTLVEELVARRNR